MNRFWEILATVNAAFPSWLQIVVCSYLGVVCGQHAFDRMRERRGLLLVVALITISVLCIARAADLLVALLR